MTASLRALIAELRAEAAGLGDDDRIDRAHRTVMLDIATRLESLVGVGCPKCGAEWPASECACDCLKPIPTGGA